MPDLFGGEQYGGLARSAEISECGRYRWWLRRGWEHGGNGQTVCFVMLNPSTADGTLDDATIRRCIAYACGWGYSALSVRNLFALRATDPKELLTTDIDPTGGLRGDLELAAARTADLVVCAWGAGVPRGSGRDRRALELLAGKPLFCLGTTGDGHPRHPLYVRADQQPIPFAPDCR